MGLRTMGGFLGRCLETLAFQCARVALRSLSFLCLFVPASSVWAGEARVIGKVVAVRGAVTVRSANDQAGTLRSLKAGTYCHSSDIISTPSDGSAKLLLDDRSIIDIGPSSFLHLANYIPASQSSGDSKSNAEESDRKVELNLIYGNMRTAVTKPIKKRGSFRIRTTNTVMGVRGTEFVMQSSLNMKDANQLASFAQKNGLAGENLSILQTALSDHQANRLNSDSSGVPKVQFVVLQGRIDVASASIGSSLSKETVSLSAGQSLSTDAKGFGFLAPQKLSVDQLRQVAARTKVDENVFRKTVAVEPSGSTRNKEEGSRGPASSATKSDQPGANQTERATQNTTEKLIQDTVIAAASPQGSAAPILNPPPLTPQPVVIPAGGLKQVTIRINRN